MKALLALFFLLLVIQTEKPDPEFTVKFQIKNAGITVDGQFKEASFDVRFDPKNLKDSFLRGKVRSSSIDTGISLRDRHLQGRQYFKSDFYPEISLESKRIQSKGKNEFEGVFELKIKDVRKEMLIPFSAVKKGNGHFFKANFTLDRLEFGIGEKSLVLGDEVVVWIEFQKVI
jgi:polyisoprenoid-binding protein YceI